MRQIFLDTETTGLNPRTGDRVIEIGCVELVNRQLTGNNFHRYINPERESDPGALAVHGLTSDFLSDKPKFSSVIAELCAFVTNAEIIIHNAPFDVGFLDVEFEKLGYPSFKEHVNKISDTLQQAKELYPGKRNSLDALCERYGISNAHRTLHGALLDAELLAEVYLAMTRGQDSLTMDLGGDAGALDGSGKPIAIAEILVVQPNEAELAAHEVVLKSLDKEVKGQSLWRQLSLM